jgi:hypothetical protein
MGCWKKSRRHPEPASRIELRLNSVATVYDRRTGSGQVGRVIPNAPDRRRNGRRLKDKPPYLGRRRGILAGVDAAARQPVRLRTTENQVGRVVPNAPDRRRNERRLKDKPPYLGRRRGVLAGVDAAARQHVRLRTTENQVGRVVPNAPDRRRNERRLKDKPPYLRRRRGVLAGVHTLRTLTRAATDYGAKWQRRLAAATMRTQVAQNRRTTCKECTKAVRQACGGIAAERANIGKLHQTNA